MRVRIDGGATHLPLCACGWRGQPCLDRSEALHQAVHHERRAHPGDFDADGMARAYRRRHRDS